MSNMQDKEFDALFRNKLNDVEAEPSAGVWPRIEAELPGRSRKLAWRPAIGIAASLLALTAFGWWMTGQKPVKNTSMVAIHLAKPVIKTPSPDTNANHLVANTPVKTIAVIEPQHKTARPDIHQKPETANNASNQPDIDVPDQKPDEHPVLASVQNTSAGTLPDAATVNELKISTTPTINTEAVTAVKLPVNAIAYSPVKQAQPKTVKHRIRTLGDLINKVVASVDKRHDKFIEFTNTDDDDESNITGINLGIVKIKKDENK